ncbi:hypothetical protein SLA2020_386840 [Shorea laevis]
MGGEEEGKTVCVTGASGFIASWLVKLLLQRGYTVKATVRDPNDPKKTEHLLALDGAKERLHLFKAELCDEGSFDSVVDGCEGVFHTASPVFLSSDEHHKSQTVDSAVNGTLNVLKSCAKVSSIKRVVLTSSMAAVANTGKPLTPDVLVDETWFSDPDLCEKSKHWYRLSKTLAEKAAWKFAEENGIDLVAINPGVVLGPFLQPTVNFSTDFIIDIVKGRQLPPFNIFVDVRDVAFAHILAFEVPSASGRYCMVERTADYSEVLKILDELYPDLHLSEKFKDKDVGTPFKVSKERAISLSVNFIPLQVSLKDTVESLKEKGFLSI